MNNQLEAKRRVNINALKEADNIRLVLESKGITSENKTEYERIIDLRTNYIIKLILLYYPYVLENDLVAIKVDGVSYPIPLSELEDNIDENIFEMLINGTYHDPDEAKFKNSGNDEIIDVFIGKDNKARHFSTEEYAFIGLTAGCGTTHTALMFARTLANIGKTAYVEVNGSLDISAYAGKYDSQGIIKFEDINNLDAYYGYDYSEFVRGYRDLYEFVVLDFGFYDEEMESIEDYVRTPNRYIVSSSARWSLPRIQLFEKEQPFNTISCIYVFPLANHENIEHLGNILGNRRVIEVPFNSDPLKTSSEIAAAFRLQKQVTASFDDINATPSAVKVVASSNITNALHTQDDVIEVLPSKKKEDISKKKSIGHIAKVIIGID